MRFCFVFPEAYAEEYPEPSQTSKTKLFAKIVNGSLDLPVTHVLQDVCSEKFRTICNKTSVIESWNSKAAFSFSTTGAVFEYCEFYLYRSL